MERWWSLDRAEVNAANRGVTCRDGAADHRRHQRERSRCSRSPGGEDRNGRAVIVSAEGGNLVDARVTRAGGSLRGRRPCPELRCGMMTARHGSRRSRHLGGIARSGAVDGSERSRGGCSGQNDRDGGAREPGHSSHCTIVPISLSTRIAILPPGTASFASTPWRWRRDSSSWDRK